MKTNDECIYQFRERRRAAPAAKTLLDKSRYADMARNVREGNRTPVRLASGD